MNRKVLSRKQFLKKKNVTGKVYFCLTEKGLQAISDDYQVNNPILLSLGCNPQERMMRIRELFHEDILTEGFYVVLNNSQLVKRKTSYYDK